ncbi:lipopolysaccharide biosynthesis protein [Jiella endophytica]|uniref:Lipopolysaccharide biosynthesis protein n=1 Tax=Jiella endophytica TaxID=2558362 RepID=A0A4Y8RJ36_9HYPH|nr:lipopolysaccharide biosynthesis protein [Jiella endophytica]TFF21974.1 lipopolysaccharide biosynthesis protein [Jiella endophytica]
MFSRTYLIGRLKDNVALLRDYASLLSGSAGRLVLSLAYFVSVANGLTVGDFGLFATASATGIVLSRIAGFGFVSPLYRTATRRPQLIGAYTAGFLAALLASLPLIALAGAGFFLVFFKGEMTAAAFVAIVAAEVLCWRLLEVVVIVANGMGRFFTGAVIVIAGSAVRAAAALAFVGLGDGTLASWSLFYLAANAVSALGAIALCYPRRRLRWTPHLYRARLRDSLSVAGAEIVFYLQSELDKLLVLSFGGPHTAGIYAILMRLVDLTALPVRSFNTMIVQKLMRTPDLLASWRVRWGVEAGIAAVSIAGLGFLGGVLHFFPRALGNNVADAAPLVLIPLLVPAFRNLVEYQSELLYARGKTAIRAVIMAMVGAIKATLLIGLLGMFLDDRAWIFGLNGLFFALWIVSALASYAALDREVAPQRRSPLSPAPQPGE